MNVKLEKDYLKISLQDILEQLTLDDKRLMAAYLACEDDVIEDVANQLLTGWTESGWHGGRSAGQAEPTGALDIWRRRLALRCGEVAVKEIEDLKNSLKYADQLNRELHDHIVTCHERLMHNNIPQPVGQFRYDPSYKDKVVLSKEEVAKGTIRIVFDGPPGPEAGRFVEVEDESGKSVSVGEWSQEGDYWYLTIKSPANQKYEQRINQLQEELGLKLAACSCAAIMDTPETHEQNKSVTRESPAWTPAFEAVMRRTAECIELRSKVGSKESL
jgi:hypothetical protein